MKINNSKKKYTLKIQSDLYRYTTKISRKLFIKNLVLNPGFIYMYLHRKYNYYREKQSKFLTIIYKFLLQKYKIKYLFEISSEAKIGRGFYIGHLGPVIINPNAIIGENVNISSGVTIGQQNRGVKKGSPKIGNYVFIGANSIIVGNVEIGDNVLIAPGSYVNFDVPSNSIVVGNPAKVKFDNDATQGYIGSVLNSK